MSHYCDAEAPSIADEDGGVKCLYWFRRCLRFHDNPALLDATRLSKAVRCVYIIDPSTISSGSKVETNKWRFLLESLRDVDNTLRKHKSRLYVLQGQPAYVLPLLFKEWHIDVMCMEEDPTPYGASRDAAIGSLANGYGIEVMHHSSHTLHPISKLKKLVAGRMLTTLKQFTMVFQAAGPPEHYIDDILFDHLAKAVPQDNSDGQYNIPTLEQLGLRNPEAIATAVWRGGETEALKRLSYHLERRAWVACFDTPKMSSASLMASPNIVSPHLNFGCLSPRLLYWKVDELYKKIHGPTSVPSASLHGQLMVREFWYLMANIHRNFDQVEGNRLCLQVPWKKADEESMKRIIEGRTGFPWIDAIMKQLVSEGWIHSVAKHALISFITHGQVFFSWEEAAQLLETYCLDGDVCTNAALAMLLSGTSLAKPVPSNIQTPVLTGKYIDPSADFVRHYLPVLRSFPSQYIYEPWTAPLDVQQKANCVIGQEYPTPMVEHYQALHTNMLTLQQLLKVVKDRRASRPCQSSSYSPYAVGSSTSCALVPKMKSVR